MKIENVQLRVDALKQILQQEMGSKEVSLICFAFDSHGKIFSAGDLEQTHKIRFLIERMATCIDSYCSDMVGDKPIAHHISAAIGEKIHEIAIDKLSTQL